jgi:hypothetical protein
MQMIHKYQEVKRKKDLQKQGDKIGEYHTCHFAVYKLTLASKEAKSECGD